MGQWIYDRHGSLVAATVHARRLRSDEPKFMGTGALEDGRVKTEQ